MFLRARLLSATNGSASLVLAGLIFVLGMGVGVAFRPVTPSHHTSQHIGAVMPLSASAHPLEATPVRAAHPAEVLRVLDGDTFEARVHLWPGLDITTRVRLRGVDAPELRAHCSDERVKAEAARDALRRILEQGEIGISHVMLDKYGGRVVADTSTAVTRDVAAALLDGGFARRYSGGRRGSWCEDRSPLSER